MRCHNKSGVRKILCFFAVHLTHSAARPVQNRPFSVSDEPNADMRMRNHTEHRLKSVAVIALYGNQRAEMESIMNKSTSSIDRIQDPAVARETVPGRLFDSKLLSEDAVRIWAAGIDYIVGDEVAYPDENGTRYTCQQAHTAQTGWEPPAVPALWQEKVSGSAEESTDENQIEEV